MPDQEEISKPQFVIDGDIGDRALTQQLEQLHGLITHDPSTAEQVIALYAKNGQAGEEWLKLLGGANPEKRFPFRLTAALGEVAMSRGLRYVEFDKDTERVIAGDEDVKKFQGLSRGSGSNELKIAFARRAGLRRLEIYAGRLSAWRVQYPISVKSSAPQTEAS
jgi:hypothetical protein